jgi:glycosyltransferase involved in cell wall biosynthesis
LDNSFDIVITSDVMEHVRLDERAHQEIRRVLKPGGIYLFTVPHFRHQSESITRVVVTDPLDPSKDQFVMQKEYHGGDHRPLSYRSYGTDLDRYLESLGFTVDYSKQDFPEIGIMNTELFFCRLSKTKRTVASSIQTRSSEQIIKAVIPKRLKDKRDIVYFPITDWSFRYKRENHLLSKFANNGHRIFHLTVNVYPEKTPYSVTNITDNIFEVKLNCVSHFNIYTDVLDEGITESLLLSLQKMQEDLDINALSFITIPTLARLCLALKEKYGWPIIFDCLDDFCGFSNVNKARIDEEIELLRNSDLVLAASSVCATQKCTKYTKARRVTNKTLYIPNAVEFDHFKQPPQNDLLKNIKKPIAGYYGPMTTDWFDNETVEYLAINRPNVNFVFIGHTFGSNIATLVKLSNVHFLGEKPYRELPLYLYHFDVCLIPFKLTPTATHSDYLKFYEYLASGKPVISTMLPPLFPFGNLCYLSSDQEQFLINLDRALNENDPQMVSRRIEFASKNTWQDRFDILYPEVKKLLPARKRRFSRLCDNLPFSI